ncbi:hypothetical protein C1703_03235 [Streptomyces sp. Go-475]|nr:hypothetical protein C1703_03235 [Streptomyces sp. Go-475]
MPLSWEAGKRPYSAGAGQEKGSSKTREVAGAGRSVIRRDRGNRFRFFGRSPSGGRVRRCGGGGTGRQDRTVAVPLGVPASPLPNRTPLASLPSALSRITTARVGTMVHAIADG